jgi:ankyrin repeat protein
MVLTAAAAGSTDGLEFFAAKQVAVVRASTKMRVTPLLMASKFGKLEVIKWCIAKGSKLTEVDVNGCGCIHFAAEGGNLALLEWLIQQGVPVDSAAQGHSSSHFAAGGNHLELLKCLASKFNHWRKVTNDNCTEWHFAAEAGAVRVLEWLHAVFPDGMNQLTKTECTPLHLAVLSNQSISVQWLLDHGAVVTPALQSLAEKPEFKRLETAAMLNGRLQSLNRVADDNMQALLQSFDEATTEETKKKKKKKKKNQKTQAAPPPAQQPQQGRVSPPPPPQQQRTETTSPGNDKKSKKKSLLSRLFGGEKKGQEAPIESAGVNGSGDSSRSAIPATNDNWRGEDSGALSTRARCRYCGDECDRYDANSIGTSSTSSSGRARCRTCACGSPNNQVIRRLPSAQLTTPVARQMRPWIRRSVRWRQQLQRLADPQTNVTAVDCLVFSEENWGRIASGGSGSTRGGGGGEGGNVKSGSGKRGGTRSEGPDVFIGLMSDGREVAVKRLHKNHAKLLQDETAVLLSDLSAAGGHVVGYRWWVPPREGSVYCYLALELCDYKLDEWVGVQAQQQQDWGHRIRIVKDLLQGVNALHTSGIVHGNLNTATVLLLADRAAAGSGMGSQSRGNRDGGGMRLKVRIKPLTDEHRRAKASARVTATDAWAPAEARSGGGRDR